MDALKRSRLRGFAEVILPPLLAMAAFVLLSMLLRAVDLTLLVTDGARRAEAQRVLGTASIAEISRSLGVLLLASTAGGMVLISACAVAFFVLAVFAKGGQTRTAVRMTAWGTVAFVVIATAWGWIRFQRVGELAAQDAARTATSHRAHDEGRQPPPVNMAGR
jgi:hypothetical protein